MTAVTGFDTDGFATARPVASIIIPAYNAEAFLRGAVESALAQTCHAIEVIIVDDGSSDATAVLAKTLAAADRRVIFLQHPERRGVSAARNTAIARANGDWIAVLDADDAFAPDRIEKLAAFGSCSDLDMVADNLLIHEFGTNQPRGLAFPENVTIHDADLTLRDLILGDLPSLTSYREIGFMKPIVRRDFLRRNGISYAEDIWASEDFLLYVDCLLHGARLRFAPEALYLSAIRPGSASSGRDATVEASKVSRRIIARTRSSHPELTHLLSLRQAMLDYEIFCWRRRRKEFAAAALIAMTGSKRYFAGRLVLSILRKLGLSSRNPKTLWRDTVKGLTS